MVDKLVTNVKFENLCPVCGFEMEDAPRDYNICPSCGTEFGVHDINASVLELREAWVKAGPKWWSVTDEKPTDWDPYAQLGRLGASGSVIPNAAVTTTATASPLRLTLSSNQSGVAAWNQLSSRQPASVY